MGSTNHPRVSIDSHPANLNDNNTTGGLNPQTKTHCNTKLAQRTGPACPRMQTQLSSNERNAMLYLDKELVEETRELARAF